MTIKKTTINGVFLIEPTVFGDERGYFFENYNKKVFEMNNLHYNFVQDNQSKSKKGVLRGLHFQKKHPQAKLVRVIEGEVFDVCVDLRRNSSTYKKYFGVILSGENKKMMLIPRGFAHGFLVLSDYAVFSYKCDDYYHPEDEGGIAWNDCDIGIEWPKLDVDYILSKKDSEYKFISEVETEFIFTK